MCRTLGDDFSSLSCHQIQQLVDEEGGGQGRNTPTGDGDELSANGAPVVNFSNILRAAFVPIFLCQKNSIPNCDYRKAARNTFVQKKVLVKC